MRSPYAGWWLGIICGVVAGLWALPPVRYTLAAQLQFALAADSAPWIGALDTRRSPQEERRLREIARSSPDDYLLQVGQATLPSDARPIDLSAARPSRRAGHDAADLTLKQTALLTLRFPDYPGADAHLARLLMQQRVRIQGDDKEKRTLQGRDLALMQWSLERGEHADPQNAFWPAMFAAVDFAADQDTAALRELERVRQATHWESYLYEEVLGQWRLYSLAFGDHGAAQKVGPLSLIAFPHLREMRRMAERVRIIAEQKASQGKETEAIRIRHDLMRLGQTLRDAAPWSYEALYGTEIVLIAGTDRSAAPKSEAIATPTQWQSVAGNYLALLKRHHRPGEIDWIRAQVQKSCDFRRTVEQARSDASFPGIPPGIPLPALFGSWMTGITLIQQVLTLLASTLTACLWSSWSGRMQRPIRRTGTAVLAAITIGTGAVLFLGAPATWLAACFLVSATLLLLRLARLMQHKVRESDERDIALDEGAGWSPGTTALILFAALPALFAALVLLRPQLGRLHPVAQLLTGLMGDAPLPSVYGAVRDALLCGGLPLVLVLMSGVWGWARGLPPLFAAGLGLRRTLLPVTVCLTLAYLVLMQETLRLDTEASRALSEAARNDRQWVLTHATTADDVP